MENNLVFLLNWRKMKNNVSLAAGMAATLSEFGVSVATQLP